MKTLADLKASITDALEELRAIRKQLADHRTSIANARYHAGGDPHATEALTTARLEKLRELEETALAKVEELRAIEREARSTVAGGLGVALSPTERAEAAHFSTLYPNQAEDVSLEEVQAQLKAAVIYQDRPAMFFWGNVARRRLASSGPQLQDTAGDGRDPAAGVSRGKIAGMIRDVDNALRDKSADPVIEAADQLRAAADDLNGRIRTARANRGEDTTFHRPGKVVRVPDAEIYDVSGYELAG